ncbi:hypothetical protein XA68_13373 [Ophiocordyceps unilateralis]|uniref:Carrier domain-containing protein n=1 Tax=Ophiocordyceps unilateralis TaxID=268505 RepID=A0A2A9PN29_OPHUN|nr:hypothetical protein XA68_13373 [Ophiocordyceps unilateralis]
MVVGSGDNRVLVMRQIYCEDRRSSQKAGLVCRLASHIGALPRGRAAYNGSAPMHRALKRFPSGHQSSSYQEDDEMDAMCYFVCTLGHAQHRKQDGFDDDTPPFRTVLDVLDEQARLAPRAVALGFAGPRPDSCDVLTFEDLCNCSLSAAGRLATCAGTPPDADLTSSIGLLCNSSPEFVSTWLGLMRLGWSVLLLAPQLDPPAARHLCSTLGVCAVLADDDNLKIANEIQNGVKAVEIPSYGVGGRAPEAYHKLCSRPDSSDTAYFFHSSGTSSGLPKPIAQTHFAAVGALPRFHGAPEMPATFSTTPLYHGGLADVMRSWTSGASIWLFPEKTMPITAANVVLSVNVARSRSVVPVDYFSSVPYVLQRLAEDEHGLELLQSMAIVAFGGAALPKSVGDSLVDAGVNLSSRFGSAESGFLMSSHRDYQVDREWQYLRPVEDKDLLTFEPHQDGLWELVVRPGWPVRAKTNRPDGSYATSDLFQPHPWRRNAWRYHSRADSQIALVNGKKFDPAPMEADILASTSLLRDVLIFGAGRDYPGILLFPATDEIAESGIAETVWPLIEGINAATASHGRITRPMLVVIHLPAGEIPLEKSSKGSILRRQAEERYAQVIESAYHVAKPLSSPTTQVPDEQLLPTVLDCFHRVLGRQIDPGDDLFRQGVDSIACIQIRNLLQSGCLTRAELPANILYDKGTVKRLVAYLQRLRNGGNCNESEEETTELGSVQSLVDRYSSFRGLESTTSERRGNSIVLTGATGFMGARVLHQLLQKPEVGKVYCLVRATTPQAALERVTRSLLALSPSNWDASKVECIPYQLSCSGLGLSEADEHLLIQKATIFLHLAWAVNFSLHLDSFEDHIAGTHNLIVMAAKSCARFFFISSTAAVSQSRRSLIPERLSEDATEASPLGYGRSKWVAERVCAAASEHLYRSQLSNFISIIRVGQLCADEAGVWNASEAYPLMLSTATVTGCLPDLPGELLNWLPVEVAARAVIEIALPWRPVDESDASQSETPVYHVLNPSHTSPTWKELLQWISEDEDGPPFQTVSPKTWLSRLEKALRDRIPSHPAETLLGLWGETYCRDNETARAPAPQFGVQESQRLSATMRAVKPLDRERVMSIWKWTRTGIGRVN